MITIKKGVQIGKSVRLVWNIHIGNHVFINEYSSINAGINKESAIDIGDDVMFGPGVFLQSWDHAFRKGELYRIAENGKKGNISIWKNVWVGAKAIILKGVTIGDNSVIWAWSVVTKDVPSNVVYAGNPAKFIKNIS